MSDSVFRKLPQVAKVLAHPALDATRSAHPAAAVTVAVRAELAAIRARLVDGAAATSVPTVEHLAVAAAARLKRDTAPLLRPVINATGIVLHTNLGRAPLADVAADAVRDAARGYLNLELDLGTGKRSSRQAAVRAALRALTGAEAATAVNNCAAATVLVLRALAAGKEAVISRGQLIEIGGGFRIPDVMAASGATLREVGTTNITRLADYERAIGPQTALLMRVHTSNYRVRGFTKAVPLVDLVALGKKHGVPVVDDVGSGALVDFARFGLGGEPVVADSIRTGADLVLFSGDKLLGGPQAGVIAGRANIIRRLESDPLMRAIRLDKMTLAALDATLRLYRHPDRAVHDVPTLGMIATPIGALRERTDLFADRLRTLADLKTVAVRKDTAFVGGGTFPDRSLPSVVVALTAASVNENDVAARLRTGTPAVVGRVRKGAVLLDLRTVFERDEDDLFAAIAAAVSPDVPEPKGS